MKSKKLFEKAIAWAQSKGINSIKANYGDYETPSSFVLKGEDDTFTPDITGIQRTRKNYIEIAIKDPESAERKASKWKLLSTLANRKGGKFYVLAPHGHRAFAERLVNKYKLNSQVVSI